MVHGRDDGGAGCRDLEQAGAQALVVVDDVEPGAWVTLVFGQDPRGAHPERPGLGEPGGPHGEELQQVDAVANLAGPGHPERIRLAIEVQARHLVQHDPGVEAVGVGRSGEHLDVVPQFDQTTAEVADVDALPAAVGLAAVRQQCDPQVTGHVSGL